MVDGSYRLATDYRADIMVMVSELKLSDECVAAAAGGDRLSL